MTAIGRNQPLVINWRNRQHLQPFSRSEWSEEYLLGELARDPQNMMRKYRAAFAQGRGVAWDKSGTFNSRRALPVTDVASWINANLILGRSEYSHQNRHQIALVAAT